ncbi:MAG: hypothetical protein QW503_02370 [Sulfolobales archaeon]
MGCIFRRCKCLPISDSNIKQLREKNVVEFIHKICSMCIKKQYASVKEILAKRRYVVVNTL